jgi:LacI family transcriptional regulator
VVAVDPHTGSHDVPTIESDNLHGGVLAAEHLIALGHRRIAYLGDRRSVPTATVRFRGYTRALERAGIPLDEALVRHGLAGVESADAAATALLTGPSPPTALFTSQNLVTIGVSRALRELGRQDSVALVGFDDFPLADLLRPGVTVVAQDTESMGRRAAQILFERLDGDTGPTRNYVVPTRLVVRGSGEIPAPPSPG